MQKYMIWGGKPLRGEVRIEGAKNAILPIMAASLLVPGTTVLHDCPKLLDVQNMAAILESLGCKVRWQDDCIIIDALNANCYEVTDRLSRELRSSIFLLGSIIARFSQAHVSYPGGCDIGLRPIDLHLSGLRSLGVDISEEFGYIHAICPKIKGSEIYLDYPSVGATENIMMAAATAEGQTVIRNAAKEPEIKDLQGFINAMGGDVSGAGTSTIVINGREKLHSVEYTVVPDRIVTGTMMIACAITSGDLSIKNSCPEHVQVIISKLKESGCTVEVNNDIIRIKGPRRLTAVHNIETMPYPGFPTDLQAQMLALQTLSDGTSVMVENVFENRFKHAAELRKMGANITIKDRMAIIRGVPELYGADVLCHDLRGGAALVLAGLRAKGCTTVEGIHHIERGYHHLDESLGRLGADISAV